MTPAFPLRLRRTPWTTVIRNAWLTLLSLAIVPLLAMDHGAARTLHVLMVVACLSSLAWVPADMLIASPLDKPNTVLILKNDCPVRLTHWGVQREGLACVFLYVDRPDALVAALRESGTGTHR
jgi:hypothetical protein